MASACATDTRSSIAIDWFIRCSPPRCHQGGQEPVSLTNSIACSTWKDKRGVGHRGSQPLEKVLSSTSESILKALVVTEPRIGLFQLSSNLQQAVFTTVARPELHTHRQPVTGPVKGYRHRR